MRRDVALPRLREGRQRAAVLGPDVAPAPRAALGAQLDNMVQLGGSWCSGHVGQQVAPSANLLAQLQRNEYHGDDRDGDGSPQDDRGPTEVV